MLFFMAIKDWNVWVKTLGIITIILIVLALGVFVWELNKSYVPLFTLFIILPVLGIILGFWIFGFIFYYLKKHNLRYIANIISVIGLIGSVVFSFWFIPQAAAGIFFSYPLFVVIFFLISTIMINVRFNK